MELKQIIVKYKNIYKISSKIVSELHFPTKLATLLRGDKTIVIWLLISDQMKMPNVDK